MPKLPQNKKKTQLVIIALAFSMIVFVGLVVLSHLAAQKETKLRHQRAQLELQRAAKCRALSNELPKQIDNHFLTKFSDKNGEQRVSKTCNLFSDTFFQASKEILIEIYQQESDSMLGNCPELLDSARSEITLALSPRLQNAAQFCGNEVYTRIRALRDRPDFVEAANASTSRDALRLIGDRMAQFEPNSEVRSCLLEATQEVPGGSFNRALSLPFIQVISACEVMLRVPPVRLDQRWKVPIATKCENYYSSKYIDEPICMD